MVVTLAFDVGIVHMALCVTDSTTNLVRHCNVFAIGRPKDPLNLLIDALLVKLEEMREALGHVDRVLVEQQLGRAATKNFALSAALYSHYRTRGLDVKFVNPRSKFKALASLENVPGVSDRRDELASCRGPALKKLAIQMSRAMAVHSGDTEFVTLVDGMRKKDDVSDAHLYSIVC